MREISLSLSLSLMFLSLLSMPSWLCKLKAPLRKWVQSMHISVKLNKSQNIQFFAAYSRLWFNSPWGRPREKFFVFFFFFLNSQVVLICSQSWEANWRVSWIRDCPEYLLPIRVFPRAVPKWNTFQYISHLSFSLVTLLCHRLKWQNTSL